MHWAKSSKSPVLTSSYYELRDAPNCSKFLGKFKIQHHLRAPSVKLNKSKENTRCTYYTVQMTESQLRIYPSFDRSDVAPYFITIEQVRCLFPFFHKQFTPISLFIYDKTKLVRSNYLVYLDSSPSRLYPTWKSNGKFQHLPRQLREIVQTACLYSLSSDKQIAAELRGVTFFLFIYFSVLYSDAGLHSTFVHRLHTSRINHQVFASKITATTIDSLYPPEKYENHPKTRKPRDSGAPHRASKYHRTGPSPREQ